MSPQARIRLGRTRVVPRSAARWTGRFLARAARELDLLLGPAPLDGEVVLLGLRELPSSWKLDVCRPTGASGHLEVIVYECEGSCRPPWKELATTVHEFVHHWIDHGSMLRGVVLPRWLEDGTADTIAGHVVESLGGVVKDRPLPELSKPRSSLRDLLSWAAPHGLPGPEDIPRYDLAYHVVKEVWEKDDGKTLVRLLKAFAGREEVPPPEEQERIFEEVVGEPLEAVVARLAARAPADGGRAER